LLAGKLARPAIKANYLFCKAFWVARKLIAVWACTVLVFSNSFLACTQAYPGWRLKRFAIREKHFCLRVGLCRLAIAAICLARMAFWSFGKPKCLAVKDKRHSGGANSLPVIAFCLKYQASQVTRSRQRLERWKV